SENVRKLSVTEAGHLPDRVAEHSIDMHSGFAAPVKFVFQSVDQLQHRRGVFSAKSGVGYHELRLGELWNRVPFANVTRTTQSLNICCNYASFPAEPLAKPLGCEDFLQYL